MHLITATAPFASSSAIAVLGAQGRSPASAGAGLLGKGSGPPSVNKIP